MNNMGSICVLTLVTYYLDGDHEEHEETKIAGAFPLSDRKNLSEYLVDACKNNKIKIHIRDGKLYPEAENPMYAKYLGHDLRLHIFAGLQELDESPILLFGEETKFDAKLISALRGTNPDRDSIFVFEN